ncbi:MAG: bifunctional adenosylcobinamide kinase/adenosylcobinamide-phosphate guanylyltransferase [bacterium]
MPATLFIGGMKSGKSLLAEKEALLYPAPRLYVATSELIDEEMKKRVELHKIRRGEQFTTIEEALELDRIINENSHLYSVILIDCLTFWYNNLFYYQKSFVEREASLARFAEAVKTCSSQVLMVTNEVGMGIIPENRLAREFVDFSGKANQRIAEVCQETYFVLAGKRLKLE